MIYSLPFAQLVIVIIGSKLYCLLKDNFYLTKYDNHDEE